MSDAEKPCDRFSEQLGGRASAPSGAASLLALRVTSELSAARRLREAYAGAAGSGLFGARKSMPEEAMSHDIADDYDRLMYLTLTVAIDYQRDAAALWRHAKERYNDPATRRLFLPKEVAARSAEEVLRALRQGNPHGALRYPPKDAAWWHRNASTFEREYGGDPRNLFESVGWEVARIRTEVSRPGRFQGLKGPKIFPLWLRILADNMPGYRFVGFETLPIPVDIHIARATFTTGLVRGRYDGPFDSNLIDFIRQAWTDSCLAAGDSHMSFDKPLWELSRLGCTDRHAGGSADCPKRRECPIGDSCPRGSIMVSTQGVRIDI